MIGKSESIDRLVACIRALKQELGAGYRFKKVIFHESANVDTASHELVFKFLFDPEPIDPPHTQTAQVTAPKDPGNCYDNVDGPYKFDFREGPSITQVEPDVQIEVVESSGSDTDESTKNQAPALSEVEEILALRIYRGTARRLDHLCDAATAADIIVEYDDALARGLVKGPGAIVARIQTGKWPTLFRSADAIRNEAAAKFYREHQDRLKDEDGKRTT